MSTSHWMKGAVKRPGAFRAKAKKAGMSTQAYAEKESHDPNASTRTKRQANLAKTFARYRKHGRKGRKTTRSKGR